MGIIQFFDLFGVAVFAISGALAAGKKQMDLFGVLVLAFVTALGGGTLRDVLLDSGPVFWIADRSYILMVVMTSFLTLPFIRIMSFTGRWFLISDALGLSVFTMIGAKKAFLLTGSFSIAVIMGMTTGVAGGIIRDVLSAEVPLILKKEIYATAALCGAAVFIILEQMGAADPVSASLSILATLFMRFAAIHWKLSLPVAASVQNTSSKEE